MEGVRICALAAADNAAALDLWEASVRASHDFVAEAHIVEYRELVRAALAERGVAFLGCYAAHAAFDAPYAVTQGALLAFMAVDRENHMLEMLFVAPEARGQGHGGALLAHALSVLGVRRVDVNEQNTAARLFYEKKGFLPTARSELDGSGKPYPLLHMEFIPPPPAQS